VEKGFAFFVWKGVIEMIKDEPLSGRGIGTFFLYYPEYRSVDDKSLVFLAHSDPLQYWAEMGVLAVILFYAVLLIAFVRSFRALSILEKKKDDVGRILILAPFCALGAMLVHTHITFNLQNLSILFLTGLLLAFWFDRTSLAIGEEFEIRSFGAKLPYVLRLFVLSIPFIALGYVFSSYIVGEHYSNKAQSSLFSGNTSEFRRYAEIADKLTFGNSYNTHILSVSLPMAWLQLGSSSMDFESQRKFFSEGMNILERAERAQPMSAAVPFYKGRMLEMVDERAISRGDDEVEKLYMQALKKDRLHVGARRALARLYGERGDGDKAIKIMEDGLGGYRCFSPNDIQFYNDLVAMYLKEGDTEKHNKAIRYLVGCKRNMERSRIQQEMGPVRFTFKKGSDEGEY
jgi:tetratricopeptide (TPR) repeat protein